MRAQAPKYRLSTVQAVAKDEALASFMDALPGPLLPEENLWRCQDGSSIVFKASKKNELFYMELQCQFHALPEGNVSFGLLPRMIEFCRIHGGALRTIRNNSILPASCGIYSDVFSSNAYRIARHLANHPNDIQARIRLRAEVPYPAE
ncbi:hypothetical protein WMF30_47970 [Sorangium sp. So ce134]